MHAIEEKEDIYYKNTRENQELTLVEPSAVLFKVVVNNYKQKDDKILDGDDDIGATVKVRQHGLPPQPARYLKYPEYDWF